MTEREVRRFESRIGFDLPQDFRTFLLETNGGVPDTTVFPVPGADEVFIDYFLPLIQHRRNTIVNVLDHG